MTKILTNEEFIIRANIIHHNKYDYSKVNYIKNYKKVIIICKIHGEFNQTPSAHLRNYGCKLCNLVKLSHVNKLSFKTKNFIEKSRTVHNNKYDYSKVNYIHSKLKVIIICKIHGEFKQTPPSHIRGNGCRSCAIERITSNARIINTEDFIEKSNNVHNNKYDYSKVNYINSKSKVIIICKIHGEFTQAPQLHISFHGCKLCSFERLSQKKRIPNIENFIKKANIIHNNKYDYSKMNYINSKEKVIIICKIHGEFTQSPRLHLKSNGCKLCSCKKISDKIYLTKNFIKRANTIHNNKYDYSNIDYINNYYKVLIHCKIHGQFLQSPNTHLRGVGCIMCQSLLSIIRKNILIKPKLKKTDINYIMNN